MAKKDWYIFLSMFVTICIFCVFYINNYDKDFNNIRYQILSNKNCKILKMTGNDDLTYENIGAVIEVSGNGKFEIGNLSKDANEFPNKVCIESIDSTYLYYIPCNK